MIFTFNGTAVYIYGSKRPNHGIYSGELAPYSQIGYVLTSVSIDGGDALLQSGRGGNPGDFQALLYQKEDLDPGKEHNIVVTNLPSRTDRAGESFAFIRQGWTEAYQVGYSERGLYLDIDYVVVQTAVSDKIYTTTVDDTSPYCKFVGGWGDVPPRLPARYYNTTAHVTSVADDSVTCR